MRGLCNDQHPHLLWNLDDAIEIDPVDGIGILHILFDRSRLKMIEFTLPHRKTNQLLALLLDLLNAIRDFVFQSAYTVLDDHIFIRSGYIVLQ